MSTVSFAASVEAYIKTILSHGVHHIGGRDGARRHAQGVIDRVWRGQVFLDATVQDIEAAQAVVDAYVA